MCSLIMSLLHYNDLNCWGYWGCGCDCGSRAPTSITTPLLIKGPDFRSVGNHLENWNWTRCCCCCYRPYHVSSSSMNTSMGQWACQCPKYTITKQSLSGRYHLRNFFWPQVLKTSKPQPHQFLGTNFTIWKTIRHFHKVMIICLSIPMTEWLF